jgi:DNA-binding NarL/FixJ family response regulator
MALQDGQAQAVTPSSDCIEVVLADDHQLVRSGLRSLLSQIRGVRVIAEVGDGAELLELLESVHPDVIFIDIAMPRMDGITAMERAKALYPELRFVVISMKEDPDSVKQAVAAGANAYVRKDAPAYELEMALHSVLATGRYFGSGVTEQLMQPSAPSVDDLLTPRQVEILRMLASGKSSKEIGFALGLSSKTVDVHRLRIMDRLGLRDVPSLTLFAVRQGLIKV